MTPKLTRAETEREARLNYILNAARNLFAQKGLENCSMDDIAVAAEYTRRTLYSYFKTRDELFLQIHIQDLSKRWNFQKEASKKVKPGIPRIRSWAEVLFDFCRENPQAMRMELYWDFNTVEKDRIDPDIFSRFEKLNTELAGSLREIFTEGIENGSLRPDLEVDMSISQFLYSMRSVINRGLWPGYSFAEFDSAVYLQHYLELFCRGVKKSGE